MPKLRNFSGITVEVSDEKLQATLNKGYTLVEEPKTEEKKTPAKRGRPAKTTEN